ncbi:MAG: glycosyl transferase [Ignavibacteria bacterium RBG_13_36_8]|nr:MAG: glycosyl transferase [Ignavibacteria bacterium RBG_13_36_8]
MKVLHTCFSKSWGGLEMYTLTSIRQLQNKNITAELLCYPESKIHQEAQKYSLVCNTLKVGGNFHPFQIFKLTELLKKNKYNIIHTQASRDLWTVVPALKTAGLDTRLFLSKQVGSFIIKKDFLHRFIYNRITFALAISEVITKNLLETTPLDKKRVVLLHNGIDMEKFNPKEYSYKSVRDEFNIGDGKILIGMMARFTPGKGHEEFIYAAKELSNKYSNLRFMIVGEPSHGEDKYAQNIKKLAAENDHQNKIIFTGYRSDTPNVIAGMDIFVFPSHAEAFGLALVEAMAMAKPTVCSNTDGVLDIAIDGKTSLFFQNRNAEDLTLKLEQLINSKDLRDNLSHAGRNRALEKFDINIYTDKLIELYKNSLLK